MSEGVKALNVAIIEDERMFCEMLGQSLSDIPGVSLVARAATLADGISICQTQSIDVAIVDFALPDGSGTDVIPRLLEANRAAKVIILSGQIDARELNVAHPEAVVAVISKQQAYDALRECLTSMVSERSPEVRDELALVETLTNKELEIFMLLGQGLRNRQIAAELSRSANTVMTHRKMIAVKLRCSGARLTVLAAKYVNRHRNTVAWNKSTQAP
mgnify:CR=1 FL=1